MHEPALAVWAVDDEVEQAFVAEASHRPHGEIAVDAAVENELPLNACKTTHSGHNERWRRRLL
jgi:hypothetical protein